MLAYPTLGLASEAKVVGGEYVWYGADSGESNGVSIVGTSRAREFVLQDGGATIRTRNGCTNITASKARCELPTGAPVFDVVRADGGDRADTLDASAMLRSTRLSGGHGGDLLIGSRVDSDDLFGGADDDLLYGGEGSDTLEGSPENDRLFGQGHSDSAYGGPGRDVLSGGPDNDRLRGGEGDDVLHTDPGSDLLQGRNSNYELGRQPDCSSTPVDEGFDSTSYADRAQPVHVSIDDTYNDGLAGENDNVCHDVEYVQGGSGADTLEGDELDQVFEGLEGPDALVGDAGRDRLFGDEGADNLGGAEGADVMDGGPGRDTARYDVGPKTCQDLGVTATIDGQPNDGNTCDRTTVGVQVIRDNIPFDVENIMGADGPDVLTGNPEEANQLQGSEGDDTLDGGEVACPPGGPGLCLGSLGDTLAGGLDTDTADYSRRDARLSLSLDNVANDGETGEQDNLVDIEDILGGRRGDSIVGSNVANTLTGRNGLDELTGGDGDDTLKGGLDQDIHRGGADEDTIDSRDGGSDYVFCGDDLDSVMADPGDKVDDDCEIVTS